MQGMFTLDQDGQIEGERVSRDAAKSMLSAIVDGEVESLMDSRGLDFDLDQRKQVFTQAAGQAMYLFDKCVPRLEHLTGSGMSGDLWHGGEGEGVSGTRGDLAVGGLRGGWGLNEGNQGPSSGDIYG